MQPNMSLAERLRECVKLAGGGAELARIAEIPRSTLETYLTGSNAPKPDRLVAICKALGVNGHWLLLGEGQMKNSPSTGNEAGEFFDAFEVLRRHAERIATATLTDDENFLLTAYRAASAERRKIAIEILKGAMLAA